MANGNHRISVLCNYKSIRLMDIYFWYLFLIWEIFHYNFTFRFARLLKLPIFAPAIRPCGATEERTWLRLKRLLVWIQSRSLTKSRFLHEIGFFYAFLILFNNFWNNTKTCGAIKITHLQNQNLYYIYNYSHNGNSNSIYYVPYICFQKVSFHIANN